MHDRAPSAEKHEDYFMRKQQISYACTLILKDPQEYPKIVNNDNLEEGDSLSQILGFA